MPCHDEGVHNHYDKHGKYLCVDDHHPVFIQKHLMKQLLQQQMSLRRLQQLQLQQHSSRYNCGSHSSDGLTQ